MYVSVGRCLTPRWVCCVCVCVCVCVCSGGVLQGVRVARVGAPVRHGVGGLLSPVGCRRHPPGRSHPHRRLRPPSRLRHRRRRPVLGMHRVPVETRDSHRVAR